MAKRSDITPELCRQLLSYDPETGRFFYRERPVELFKDGKQSAEHNRTAWNSKMAGKEAFLYLRNDGYLSGYIYGMRWMSQRVAWAIYYGMWPNGIIDHINGKKTDNRIINLRDVDHAANGKNMSTRPTNVAGYIGVTKDKSRGCWRARIYNGKRDVFLGRFKNVDDAIAARKEANRRLGYHENHGRERI